MSVSMATLRIIDKLVGIASRDGTDWKNIHVKSAKKCGKEIKCRICIWPIKPWAKKSPHREFE